jgi:NAD(P)-dependent dehydrogenase (short-subunit alcohol dehydrogenase family)
MSASGHWVLVTGAAGGIGAATCRRLAADGSQVWAVDRDEAGLRAVVAGLDGSGHRSTTIDLSSLSSIDYLVEEMRAAGIRLKGMIHLAAVLQRRDSIEEITEEDWDFQIDINLKVTFFLDRAVALFLIAQGEGGAIVNFASQGWWSGGFGGSVVYAASKGGIVSLSRGLARTLAPNGIRVNTVAPGYVDTAMMRSGLTDEALAANVAQVPLGHLASPEEVADAAVFLVSADSRYITGATLNVTGGQLMY